MANRANPYHLKSFQDMIYYNKILPLTNVANCRQLYFFYLALTEEKIIEIVEAGPLDYLIILYKEIGRPKRVKWAKEQNRKRKQKFRKLTTGF